MTIDRIRGNTVAWEGRTVRVTLKGNSKILTGTLRFSLGSILVDDDLVLNDEVASIVPLD